jgi:hypothetical protein
MRSLSHWPSIIWLHTIDGRAGDFCDRKRQSWPSPARSCRASAGLCALIYDRAHALGLGYERCSCRLAEVIVDTVAFVASTNEIIASWGADHALPTWPENAGPTAEGWSFPGLFIRSGRHDRKIVFARHDYAYDEEQAS